MASLLRLVGRAFLLAATVVVSASSANASAGKATELRSLAVEDLLRLEGFGRVEIFDKQRIAIIEKRPEYEAAQNTKFVTYTDLSPIGHLYQVDLSTGKIAPLFAHSAAETFWLGNASPDKEHLIIFRLANGVLRCGIYGLSTRKVEWLDIGPAYNGLNESPVWINNDIVAIAAASQSPSRRIQLNERADFGFRVAIRRELEKRWSAAFEGTVPSATVIRSSENDRSRGEGSEAGILELYSIDHHTLKTLSRGDFIALRVSGAGKYLAAIREEGREQLKTLDRVDITARRRHLLIFDVQSGDVTDPCPSCDVSAKGIEWGDQDDEIVWWARPSSVPVAKIADRDRPILVSYVIGSQNVTIISSPQLQFACKPLSAEYWATALPIGGGAVAALASLNTEAPSKEKCNDSRLRWYAILADGTFTDLAPGLNDVQPVLLGARRSEIFAIADGGIWALSAKGHRRLFDQTLPPSSTLVADSEYPLKPSGHSALGSDVPRNISIIRAGSKFNLFDPLKLQLRDVPTLDASRTRLAAHSGVYIATEDPGKELIFTNIATRASKAVRINSFLERLREPRSEAMSYSYGNSHLTACALVPSEWSRNSARRWPAILWIYPWEPGTCVHSASWQPYFENMNLLVSRGYVVLFPALPKHLAATSESPIGNDASLVDTAIAAAVQKLNIDPERIGAFGFSQGNRTLLDLLTKTHAIKAAVVANGISDLASHYSSMPLLAHVFSDDFWVNNADRYESDTPDRIGSAPWTAPHSYVTNSPTFFADKIQAPVLLVHSDFDGFPIDQSEELFGSLYRLQKTACYVTYWGEAHGPVSPQNIRDFWDRVFLWFDAYIGVRNPAADACPAGATQVQSQ